MRQKLELRPLQTVGTNNLVRGTRRRTAVQDPVLIVRPVRTRAQARPPLESPARRLRASSATHHQLPCPACIGPRNATRPSQNAGAAEAITSLENGETVGEVSAPGCVWTVWTAAPHKGCPVVSQLVGDNWRRPLSEVTDATR